MLVGSYKDQVKLGEFNNGMKYIRMGNGQKKFIIINGGPGNSLLEPLIGKEIFEWLSDFIENDYSIFVMTRKSKLAKGYAVKDMAADAIDVIDQEFSGHVDVLMGISFGGFILQEIAYQRPNASSKFIMLASSYKMTDKGKTFDTQYANLVSNKKYGKAMVHLMTALYSDKTKVRLNRILMKIIGHHLLKSIIKNESESYHEDIIIESKAELQFDSSSILSYINVPILIIGSDSDYYFPKEDIHLTAEMLKNSELRIIKNMGHGELFRNETMNAIYDYVH